LAHKRAEKYQLIMRALATKQRL